MPTSTSTSPATRTNTNLDAIRLARAYLLRVAEPPAPHLTQFVSHHGPITAAERIQANDVPDQVRAETTARRDINLAEKDLATAAAVGATLLIPEDEAWPAWAFAVLDLARARGANWAGQPVAVWARGTADLATSTDQAVAVVGARAATAYGEHIAAEFAHGLTSVGMTVVSGAAYGVDGAAHRGALTAGGPTVAALGCGIDIPYPAGHSALLGRIAESGLIISEYPPGTPPARHRFLVRNRLISALAAGTLVVEAGRRSGSRNTAATAAALGRVVMAVPGPVSSAMSLGCHELIRSGDAQLVSSVDDIIESVGRLGADLATVPPQALRETDGLSDLALRIHEALDRKSGQSAEQIAIKSGIPIERVRATLPGLELTAHAERCETGWRRRSPQPT
jgi:DNA processing protein